MSDAQEIWKAVPGYEGLYEASTQGRVRSLDREVSYQRRDQYSGKILTITRLHKGTLLRPGGRKGFHVTVSLKRNYSVPVHRIILETFVGPRPYGMEALHWDDVPSNNALKNLRWGSRTQNLLDAVRNGKKPVGEYLPQTKLKASDIPTIRRLFGRTSIAAIARMYGVSESSIRQIRDGKSWKHVQ